MDWDSRLREAAYTPPSGVRLKFKYEKVTQEVDKKTSAFNFPGFNGTLVQDHGHTSRRYPLRIFFSGPDHDLESTTFEKALLETGEGKLEHPTYGVKRCVPFGKIRVRNDLTNEANQTVIEVVFWETIGAKYPVSQDVPSSKVLEATSEYNEAVAEAFIAPEKNQYMKLLDSAKSGLKAVAETQADVMSQFNAINDSITQGINTLVAEPLALAFQTVLMIQAPARALTSIVARLSAYSDLALSLMTGEGAVVTADKTGEGRRLFSSKELFAATYVSSGILSVLNTQFKNKSDALEAADLLLSQFDTLTAWRDNNFEVLGVVDTGESYQKLQSAVAIAAGYLVDMSFTLLQERYIVLTRNRTIVDLCAELYGATDDMYDVFINSNNLSGDEHLEIKRGREIVYYI